MVNRTALQNLTRFDRIVNPDGTPSELFMRILQGKNELSASIQDIVTNLNAIEIDTVAPISGGPIVFADFVQGNAPFSLSHGDSGATAGIYGDSGHVAQVTVDAKGHVTLAANVAISGLLTDGDKGDIVVSSSGTVWTIDANVVTFAKFQQSTGASKILGRGSASGAGNFEELTLGAGLTLTGTVLSASVADGDKGDIVVSSSGTVWTIDTNAVTFAKFQQASGASKLLGRGSASGAGNFEEITIGTGLSMSGTAITCTLVGLTDGDKGDVVISGTGTVFTIDANVVTYAKMQQVSATNTFLGRKTAGAGNVEEISAAEATAILNTFTSGLKGLAPASGGGTTNFLRADGTWAAPAGGGGGGGTPWYLSPPLASAFTLAHFTGANNLTLTDDTDEGLLFETGASGNNDYQVAYKTVSAGASFDLKVRMLVSTPNSNFAAWGLLVWNPSTNRALVFGTQTNEMLQLDRITDSGGYNSTVWNFSQLWGSYFAPWWRIVSDGTTLTFYVSAQGKIWTKVGTDTLAGYIGSYTRVGFHARTNGDGSRSYMHTAGSISYWSGV